MTRGSTRSASRCAPAPHAACSALVAPAVAATPPPFPVLPQAAALPRAAQEALRERIDGWLKEHGAKLAHQPPATHSDSEEDEEGDHPSYCGRAGCRDYPHEHVAWKEKKPAEKRVVPRELRQL